MRGNQVHPVLFEVFIQSVTIIGAGPNEMLRLGLQHVEVETELDQGDFMMIRRMRTDGERESMSIHNRENLHALAAFREAARLAAALGGGKCGLDEALAFVDHPVVAQGIGQLREHLALTPLLESPMDRFVVGIALRQQVPLRAGVQNPEHGVQDRAGRDRFAPGTVIRNVLLGKMLPNSVPLVIAQPQHDRTYRDMRSSRQLF